MSLLQFRSWNMQRNSPYYLFFSLIAALIVAARLCTSKLGVLGEFAHLARRPEMGILAITLGIWVAVRLYTYPFDAHH